MHYSTFLVMASAACAFAQDSGSSGNYSSSLDMELSNPGAIDEGTRRGWCIAQYNTCNALCEGDWEDNDCEDATLEWECACASNSSQPGIEYYEQTVPSFICQELYRECEANNGGDQRVSDGCKTDIRSHCDPNELLEPPSLSSDNDDDDDDDESTSSSAEATTSTTSNDDSEATGDDVTTTDEPDFAAPTLMPGNGVAAVAAIGVLAYMI